MMSPTLTTKTPGAIAPHGGELVNLLLDGPRWEDVKNEAEGLPRLELSDRSLNDLDMLSVGVLSPLTGFMSSADYRSVIDNTRLADGLVWSIPVALGISEEQKASIGSADAITLTDGGRPLAVLRVEEIYQPDLDKEARNVYGTTDQAHPGVAAIHQRGPWLLGGWVEAVARHVYTNFTEARLTPIETRRLFDQRGWRRIVAFQTRNPIHRAHEYLVRCALEMADGLLIHPLMGATKKGDIPAEVRWQCYQTLLSKYFPPDRVMLSIFPANMHYAGPREAIYHSLCRKNFGVTHFIVGRDHAGVGDYYGSYDAQKIFDQFDPEEIGIEPLCFEHAFWSHRLEGMASYKTCSYTDKKDVVMLSGTKVRELLNQGIVPPEAFTRREVAEILIRHYRDEARREQEARRAATGEKASWSPEDSVSAQSDQQEYKPRYEQGITLWFTGLPSSGKSTITQMLAPILRARGRTVEVFDGDEVRQNLSKELGFSKEDRDTHIKRIGYVCRLLSRHGAVTISAAISPYKDIRDFNRKQCGNFIEVYVECPLDVLVERDPKGLYKKALAGEIKNFTGVSDPYEAPDNPEIHIRSDQETVEQSVEKIIAYLEQEEWLR